MDSPQTEAATKRIVRKTRNLLGWGSVLWLLWHCIGWQAAVAVCAIDVAVVLLCTAYEMGKARPRC